MGVDRLTRERVAEIADDFKPWFPYHEHEMGHDYSGWENSVMFSRVPSSQLQDWVRNPDPASRKHWVRNPDPACRKRAYLEIPKSGLTEEALLACLMSLMLGLAEPQAIFGFDELKRPDAMGQWDEWVSRCIEKWKDTPPEDPFVRNALEAAGLLPKPAPALPE